MDLDSTHIWLLAIGLILAWTALLVDRKLDRLSQRDNDRKYVRMKMVGRTVSVFSVVVITALFLIDWAKRSRDEVAYARQVSEVNDARRRQEKAQTDLDGVKAKLAITQTELRTAKTEIAKLQPKPLRERLVSLLDEIDPKIIPALRQGERTFDRRDVAVAQYAELQQVAREDGAERFITVINDTNLFMGTGSEGVTHRVRFTLDPSLLE